MWHRWKFYVKRNLSENLTFFEKKIVVNKITSTSIRMSLSGANILLMANGLPSKQKLWVRIPYQIETIFMCFLYDMVGPLSEFLAKGVFGYIN